jgi:hypothetical protein
MLEATNVDQKNTIETSESENHENMRKHVIKPAKEMPLRNTLLL